MGNLRSIALSGAAFVGLVTPSMVLAQSGAGPSTPSEGAPQGTSTAVPEEVPQAASPATSEEAATAAANEGADIIVTANRREQRLQDVPITVNVLDGDFAVNLGIDNTAVLQATVPSLVLRSSLNQATPFLRGIGFSSGDANSENSVAMYVDGVYYPAGFGNLFDFNNIERIEVLKGPQGTLFGRNTTGGVIHIITRDPSSTPELDARISYGNYDAISANLYAAGGTDKVAGGLAILYNRHDGWGKNLTTGKSTYKANDFAARGRILITPGPNTEIRLTGDHFSSDTGGIEGQVPRGATTVAGTDFPGDFNTEGNLDNDSDVSAWGGSLRVDQDFDFARLVSISAYRRTKSHLLYDQDNSPLPFVNANFRQDSRMYTQEVQLISPTASRLQWLVGAFYFNYKAGFEPVTLSGWVFDPNFPFNPPFNPDAGIDIFGKTHTKSFAVFGQATYPLGERTNLTVGGRYTWENVHYRGSVRLTGTDIIVDPFGEEARRKTSDNDPTWRLSIDHRFNPDIMVYASWNRGLKSGNFSVASAPSVLEPYKAEKLDAYEAGFKADLFGRRLYLNGAVFYYDFANIQFQRIEGGVATIFNGPTAKLYGAELELRGKVTPDLTVNAGIGWLHTRIGNFPNAPNSVRLPDGTTGPGDPNFNAKGNDLPYAPDVTFNAGFSYDIPTNVGRFNISGNGYYNDGYSTEVDNRLKEGSYFLLNASVGWTHPSERYEVRIWGQNLTDAYYYQQLTSQAGFSDVGNASAPRTYGVTLRYHYQ